MLRLICVGLVTIVVSVSLVCDSNQNSSSEIDATPQPDGKTAIGEMRRVNLPFDGMLAVKSDNGLLILGEDRLVRVNRDGQLGNPLKYRIVNQLRTKGMTTIEPFSEPPVPNPELCPPSSGVSIGSSVLVFAECDHTNEWWRIDLKSDHADVDVLSFPYESQYQPQLHLNGISANEKKLFLFSSDRKSPVLLEIDPNQWKLRTVWKGERELGLIENVKFIGGEGFMLLNSGDLFRSSDHGMNWQRSSRVFSNDVYYGQSDIALMNEKEAVVVSAGRVFFTADGGQTWSLDESILSKSVELISVDSDFALTTIGGGAIAFKTRSKSEWSFQTILPDRPIAKIALADGMLAVFSRGEMYLGTFLDHR